MVKSFYKSDDHLFTLLLGDSLLLLSQFDFKFDMIFADPPYFLSNGGVSVSNGKLCCVDKGNWDKLGKGMSVDDFNKAWLLLAGEKLKDNGTIWITATHHNLFSVGHLLSELNYKILNVICWEKTDPPPNLLHRTFIHSHEFLIWARKNPGMPHCFNYEVMSGINNGEPMKDVWRIPAVEPWEKKCGKHPTQKPIKLVSRAIRACTAEGGWILDPFCGSGTTGIAANLLKRRFLGIDNCIEYIQLSKLRKIEIECETVSQQFLKYLR